MKRTPSLSTCYTVTSGSYPQVSGGGLDLTLVNANLRRAVEDPQRSLASGATRGCRASPLMKFTYRTIPDKTLISASTKVVSALIPTLILPPLGNDGETWISETARVPSGVVVSFPSLIAGGRRGLSAVAVLIRRQAIRDKACVGNAVGDSSYGPRSFDLRGRYDFALIRRGLAIGFANGQIAGPSCGRIEVTVPYALLQPYLSAAGRKLIADVRLPSP